MDYLAWNASIFNYFFNNDNSGKDILFSVDEYVIKGIGKANNILESDAINNFCKNVSENFDFIKEKRDKKELRINLKDISIKIRNGIPEQTAVLAMFILAASKMGTDSEKNLSCRNYFVRLEELLQTFRDRPITTSISNEYSEFYNLFNSFADYLNNDLKGAKGTIYFDRLYSHNERKKEDYVGIPIYQSMISEKDRCLLSIHFDSVQNNHKELTLNDIDTREYSRVFRSVSEHNVYRNKLEEKIKELYDNWDEEVCEIDSKTGIKSFILKPRYLYKMDSYKDSCIFYETMKYKKSLDKFEWNNNLFKKTCDFENFYNPVSVNPDQINLSQEKIHIINEKLKVKRPLKNFILFQKDENIFGGYYLEVDNVEVGDVFSIMAPRTFFKSNIEVLRQITGDSEIKPKCINNQRYDLMIIENIVALIPHQSLNIFQYDKVQFKKGLRKKNTNDYLKSAEPLIYLEKKLGYGSINYWIDNKKGIYIDTPIDLRVQNNDIRMHTIITDSDKRKDYRIVDKLEDNDFDPIYDYFDDYKLNKLKERTDRENLINGCYIENYRPKVNQGRIDKILSIINYLDSNHNKFISKNLFAYTENINKSIDSEKYDKLNKHFKNKMLTDNIELKYLQVLEKDGVL